MQGGHGAGDKAGKAAHQAAGFAGVDLFGQKLAVLLVPAVAHGAEHAHGQCGFGVAQAVGGYAVGLGLGLLGFAHDGARDFERHVGEEQDEHRGHGRKDSQVGVKQPANANEHQRKGRLDDGKQGRAGEELAQVHQVTQQLVHVHVFTQGVAAKGGVKDVGADVPVDAQGQAHHQALADPFQSAPKHIDGHDDEGERDQGDAAAAAQDPVEHVEHVEHGRQAQQLQQVGQAHDQIEGLLALAQDLAQRRLERRARGDLGG